MRLLLFGVTLGVVLLASCGDRSTGVGAGTPTPDAAPVAARHTIPDDFPLLRGYPRDRDAESDAFGRSGPNRTMKPMVPGACGARVQVPDHADRLRARWTNPEDLRDRQLVDFAHRRGAGAYVHDLLGAFRACAADGPRDDTRHSRVTATRRGDQGGVITSTYTYRGDPRPGLLVTHVVRVGTAVLLSATYNEGGAGPHPAREAAAERRRTGHQIDGVVRAMADRLN